jgi:3-hydroxyisobutyrate dehydrogenase-like beta-hydroxyacid dehydrogenase
MPGLKRIGIVGAGTMGGGMARNLMKAGHTVSICDLDDTKVSALAERGAIASTTPAATVSSNDITLVSLPTSGTLIKVAEADDGLLQGASNGKIIVDVGTTSAPETRRLAEAFREKDAFLVDAPVSGGGGGADAGTLAVMVGGDDSAVAACQGIFDAIGGNVVHLGPAGAGQLGKAVNQMAMGVAEAAYLEAMLVGVKGGLDPDKIWQVLSTAVGRNNTKFERVVRSVANGSAGQKDCKLRELPYFIEEAKAQGYTLPMTEAFEAFCRESEKSITDPLGIPTASYWNELTNRLRE